MRSETVEFIQIINKCFCLRISTYSARQIYIDTYGGKYPTGYAQELVMVVSIESVDNVYIDSLLGPLAFEEDTITYSFWSDPSVDDHDGIEDIDQSTTIWTADQMAAMATALTSWSDVADISFEQVADNTDADLHLTLISSDEATFDGGVAAGLAYLPHPEIPGIIYINTDLVFDVDIVSLYQPGGLTYTALIHEIGHSLGLTHPHDDLGNSSIFPGVEEWDDLGYNDLNQGIWTTMSYNVGWQSENTSNTDEGVYAFGYQMTPMAFDVAAIQHIYGPNLDYNTGDDTYILPENNGPGVGYSCLWDAGGNDTISAETVSRDTTIMLLDAPLVGQNAGGHVSTPTGIWGGFTIANGVVIENATGGSGNDLIVGNETDNALLGNNGDDRIAGGDGVDYIDGGDGEDWVGYGYQYPTNDYGGFLGMSINLLSGRTQIVYSGLPYITEDTLVNIENIAGSVGSDTIVGNNDANKLYGNQGYDVLVGAGGDDILIGFDVANQASDVDYLYGDGRNFAPDTLNEGDGADKFVLASVDQNYYLDDASYAVIADFNSAEGDQILLHGSELDFSLGTTNSAGSQDLLDTTISYNGELIGIVADTTNVDLGRDCVFLT